MNNILTPAQLLTYWDNALPIDLYFQDLETYVPDESKEHDKFIDINKQRVRRILKTLHLSPEIEQKAMSATSGRKWLVITEHWCGDSAQILPVLKIMAHASKDAVEVRVLFRDQNLPLIDAFLTHGSRGIPKVVAMDSEGATLSTWGPRPQEAGDLVKRIKADPSLAHTYSEELHKWYARDKQLAIQTEAAVLFA